jgi:hypothetical protein
MLFDQHDARWIEKSYPGEGNILIFSNGRTRPGEKYSSIDEIKPPIDDNGSYFFETGKPFGPKEQLWIYTAENPSDFYATHLSGAQRMKDGNTIICNGPAGLFFIVTPEKNIIWEYENPYPKPVTNDVFTVRHYPLGNPIIGANLDCEGSLYWNDARAGETVNGEFKLENIGESGSNLNWEIEYFPKWGNWSFEPATGKNLTPEEGHISVQVSVVSPDIKNEEFFGSIRIKNSENSSDWELIPVYIKTKRARAVDTEYILLRLLTRFPLLKKIFISYYML